MKKYAKIKWFILFIISCKLIYKITKKTISLLRHNKKIRGYKKQIESNSNSGEIAGLLYMIGKIYQNSLKNYKKAIKTYTEIIESHPDSVLTDNSMYNIAECQELMQNYPIALKSYQKLIHAYPQSSRINDAKYKISELKSKYL